MLNYGNLNDNEFESLCKDIMSKKLGIELRKFAPGKDGGIDLVDDIEHKNIIVQVKHYTKTSVNGLILSLKKELPKVQNLKPKQYYICCSKELTPQNISEIYAVFKDYMESDKNIITLTEIDDYLAREENDDILRKNFKLWIESTNILQDILTNDICIDCEALLYDVENDVKFFVETTAYRKALQYLSNNNVILITGDPGVGKTTTSKMLILYYASLGYKVRYTTDGTDLAALKKALSLSPDEKEIILLDDCFGQAYFNMKETQGNELLAIIKHIKLHPNKFLILNSRVTIYSEAREKNPALLRGLERGDYKLHVIDITSTTAYEKAQILYNHLYFNMIMEDYFEALKKNRNYRTIITHRNYNPRIIEFVCNPKHFAHISPAEYFSFVLDNLNQPFHIWKNEYEERLSAIDRLLLTTLYSLTTTIVAEHFLRSCFCKRLKRLSGIDLSVNHFDRSLHRLENSFVKIVDYRGKKMVSVCNPSINDFLDAYLAEDMSMRNELIESSCSILQFKRLLDNNAYLHKIQQSFEDGSVLEFCFENEVQKYRIISYFVTLFDIQSPVFEEYVHKYICSVSDVNIYEKQKAYAISIFEKLTAAPLCEFYHLNAVLTNFTVLSNVLRTFEFEELITAINCIDGYFKADRDNYISVVENIIEDAIEIYCDDIDADSYSLDLDVDSIIEDCTYDDPDGGDIDIDEAADMVEDAVKEIVVDQVLEILSELPSDIDISTSFVTSLNINVNGCDYLIADYLDINGNYEDEGFRDHLSLDTGYNDIDLLFK